MIEKIGYGATSNVYLAIDLALHQKWAIKEIKQLTGDEIAVLKRIRHALIPQLIDRIEEMEKTYLVFEYIEGYTADVYVKKYGYIMEKEALIWCRSLTDILSYLHGLHPPIIHQDIKPSNIIIKPDGTLRLLDFGIAEELHDDRMRERAYGSFGYAAPEQFGDKAGKALYPIDGRTDIYALGKTLQHVLGIREEVEKRRTAFAKVLERCASKEPDMRYQTANELSYAVERIFQNKYLKNKYFAKYTATATVLLLSIIIGIAQTRIPKKQSKDSTTKRNSIDMDTNMNGMNHAAWNKAFFESGKMYFHKFGQYNEALLFFELVSEETYPEVHYYINICNSLTEMKSNYAIVDYNLRKLAAYKRKRLFSIEEAEEILDIGHLYIVCRCEINDSLIKAEEILEAELQRIEENMPSELESELIRKYKERLFEVYYYREPVLTETERTDTKAAMNYGEEAVMGLQGFKQDDEILICRLAKMYEEQGKEEKVLACYRRGERILQYKSVELYADYLTYLLDSYDGEGKKIKEMKEVYNRALMVEPEKENKRLDKAIYRAKRIVGGMMGEEK